MTKTRSSAEYILDAHEISRTQPTVLQLSALTEQEWLTVIDGIIDRTFVDDERREHLQHILNDNALYQRYYERQVASMELLRPLLPWFIKRAR